MALHNQILKDIQDGKIPEIFTLNDLKKAPLANGKFWVGGEAYGLSTLNTSPANLSIDAQGERCGKHVQKGATPKYIRLGRGKYTLNCIASQFKAAAVEDEAENDNTIQGEPFQFNAITFDDAASIPEFICRYLNQTPFQYYFKKQSIKHPKKPALGLARRLNAYFWPNLSVSWQQSQALLDGFIAEFNAIELKQEHTDNAAELLTLFEKVCKWGGVNLPAITASELKIQVFSVLNAIDNGALPDSRFKINSAYTKLYAIARPDSFVIFDSRVAAALTSIMDSAYDSLTQLHDWPKYQNLGFVNGRGGSRPRLLKHTWKNGYQQWPAQIAANKLCLDIVAFINKTPELYGFERPISLRELEAILFMEGY